MVFCIVQFEGALSVSKMGANEIITNESGIIIACKGVSSCATQ